MPGLRTRIARCVALSVEGDTGTNVIREVCDDNEENDLDDAYVFGRHWVLPSRIKSRIPRCCMVQESVSATDTGGSQYGVAVQSGCVYIGVLVEGRPVTRRRARYSFGSSRSGTAHSLVHV